MLTVRIQPDLVTVVRPTALTFDGLRVLERDPALERTLLEAEGRIRTHPPPERTSVRAMYRAVGLDPTKTRPSSAALLRRVGRGDPLPRINSLVDVCNWCSLEFQLPYGLYDLDAVRPPIELRLGRPGETYAGIRKDVVHLQGRLSLADALGPFGNPTSDSARTRVTTATVRALVFLFVPAQLDPAELREAVGLTASRVQVHCGGRETWRFPEHPV